MSERKTFDIGIIGGGAAGLSAAIAASFRGKSVVILDQNKKPGSKIYATGNGRCNLANAVSCPSCYYGNELPQKVFENVIPYIEEMTASKLAFTNQEELPYIEIKAFFDYLGLPSKFFGNGLYPASEEASSVVWAMKDAVDSKGVTLLGKSGVKDVKKQGENFLIQSHNGDEAEVKNLLLAMGSPSGKGLGSAKEEDLYNIFEDLNLSYEKFTPALCPLACQGDFSEIMGVRARVKASLKGYEEEGQLQLTDYGLSGICIFNLSPLASPGDVIEIDFIPDYTEEELLERLQNLKDNLPNRRLLAFINGFMNDKLAAWLIKTVNVDLSNKTISSCQESDLRTLLHAIKHYKFIVKSRFEYSRSQASCGGIHAKTICQETMEIEGHKGLYAAGEVTEVIGKCGGYNLSYAILSGYLAGSEMAKEEL